MPRLVVDRRGRVPLTAVGKAKRLLRPVVSALPAGPRRGVVAVAQRARRLSEWADAARVGMQRARSRSTFGFPVPSTTPVRLLVAPTNSAGQGWAWARAVERHSPGTSAHCLSLANVFDFPADYAVTPEDYKGPIWGVAHRHHVLDAYSHVLVEAGRAIFGRTVGLAIAPELPILTKAGLSVALLSHGSDARIPSRHAEREPYSPFRTSDPAWTARLEASAVAYHELLSMYDGHVLVSTPDLVDDLPRARWCPVVVDLDRWRATPLDPERRRPVVVHIPSKGALKGSDAIDPVLSALAEQGLIDYHRLSSVPAAEMPALYAAADIVADQFSIGSYGVAACEAMAAGRVVLGHVAPRVRDRVRVATGMDLPVVETTPETIAEVLADLAANPERCAALGSAGVGFVSRVHDGRMAVSALTPFLAAAKPVGEAS